MTSTLVRIISPYFVCGIVVKDHKVVESAGIVRYMVDWSSQKVRDYCDKKGWKYESIERF